MIFPTIYAKITPTNGVTGDIYRVDVSGIDATVEAAKEWRGGTVSFAIVPSSLGTLTVTFVNVTTNVTIGTKTLSTVVKTQ